MAKDKDNQGGPSYNPKDEDAEGNRQSGESAQAQSGPEGDNERRNREDAGQSRRNGSQSNAS